MLPVYNLTRDAKPTEAGDQHSPLWPHDEPIALVCMPWGSISRGSIALGILKQCAVNIGFAPDVHYLNIKFAEKLGFELYEKISADSALHPEWFFSSALFGPNGLGLMRNGWSDLRSSEVGAKVAEKFIEIVGGSEDRCRRIVDDLIPQFIDECLADIEWSKYKVIGFSSTFAQTLASLLLSKRIKDIHPDTKVILGGANADSEMGFEIIKAFDWMDYVVHGEAEQSFPQLLRNVFRGEGSKKIPGVSMRCGDQLFAGFSEVRTINDLNESPPPDYTDYFKEVERTKINKTMRIKLSFESSRGCWWGAKQHCTFCGLNGSTMAFRKKSPARVYDEIVQIANKYKCLTLNAVDNILDMGYFNQLLPRLAEADLDLSIFYEVKANLTQEQVRRLAAAGITKIQPGIESFNTEILRLMRKGVKAIQNIQLLKWCFEYGIDPSWNILYGFPGESPDQYADCADIFRLLTHLRPPSAVTPVVFERFSPYHFEREKFKLVLTPVRFYEMIYPKNIVDHDKIAYYYEGRCEERAGDPQEYMAPTLLAHEEWSKYWAEGKVFFYYEKGPGFLTLHDNRPRRHGDELTIRRLNLNDVQSRIFLFCDENRSFSAIQKMLQEHYRNGPNEQQTRKILEQFVEQRLVFREDDRYLSLAVRSRARKARHLNAEKDAD